MQTILVDNRSKPTSESRSPVTDRIVSNVLRARSWDGETFGRRLMEAQDQAVFEWLREGGIDTQSFEASAESILRIQKRVNEITKTFPGGAWVVRVMRVIPVLKEVRLDSRDLVSEEILEALRKNLPDIPEDRLAMATKLTIELMFSATEMALEVPEREEEITREVCFLVASYHARLRNGS